MNQTQKISAHANGRPRTIKRANWKLTCRAFEKCAADIECWVEKEKVLANTGYFLRLDSPEQCEFLAAWLMQAANFSRRQNKQRTARQRS